MFGGSTSLKLKLTLLVLAALIVAGTFYYTNDIVQSLQNRERQVVELFANGLEYIANNDASNQDYTFIFENIVKPIDFPMILTDANDNPNVDGIGGGYKNLDIDTTLSKEEIKSILKKEIIEMSVINPPIIVTYADSIIQSKIYYGDSKLIAMLRYYPFLQVISALVFILIAYVSFSYVKKTEQSNIWVGLSKETAHQLGTPISSLLGWNEILKMSYAEPDKVLDVTYEMDSDLERLNKIAQRFSKIGSKPELKENNIYEILERVVNYFHRRLPHTGKNVSINLHGENEIMGKVNPDLFEWVIENLIKNALDAIESSEGKIDIRIVKINKLVEIEVEDNGKGIDQNRKKEIFKPGYSTKRRGWGLGLSLSKRIVEDYHRGKIFVKTTSLNEGTTFKIILE
ncbi:MAG: two-component sensor histidine kinase [Ignavibacteriae bacterium]|nr:two-component sensor histidine kinase [Ignavibacteriota bacterium]